MAHCVNSHETTTEDFCDTCGMPVVPDAPPPAPEPEICPNCGAPRLNHSLFCESCGYDYTTGALPQQDLRTELGLPPTKDSAPDAPSHGDLAVGHGDLDAGRGQNELARSAEAKEEVEARSAEHGSSVTPSQDGNLPISDNTSVPQESEDDSTHGTVSPQPETPPSTPVPKQHIPWVAEVWVDPQWYAYQESTDPMPPQGPPRIVHLKESALIGRHSSSRNINPDIDCEPDTGCSRRQAYLTSADGYWYINDLESSNGTFVADATASLPDDPITARTQITPDMRIYVGAWTRIVVRPAIEQELTS